MKEGPKPVYESNKAGPSTLHFEISLKPSDKEAVIKPIKPNPQASVKRKKGLARNRAFQSPSHSIRASTNEEESRAGLPLVRNAMGRNPHEEELGSEENVTVLLSQGQFSTGYKSNLGFQFRGGSSRDHDAALNGEKCDGGGSKILAEGSDGEDGGEEFSDMEVGASNSTKSHAKRSGFEGVFNYAEGVASKGEADRKDGGGLERMELKGGVDGTSAF